MKKVKGSISGLLPLWILTDMHWQSYLYQDSTGHHSCRSLRDRCLERKWDQYFESVYYKASSWVYKIWNILGMHSTWQLSTKYEEKRWFSLLGPTFIFVVEQSPLVAA